MKILLIDTHGTNVNLRLYINDKLKDFIIKEESVNHSEITMPTLKELLTRNNLIPQNIDKIIVVNGPGSFTGERIGVTIAKTLAYTLNIPISTITSLELYGKENMLDGTYFIKEKNGYYLADLISQYFTNYKYLTKNEFLSQDTQNYQELKEEVDDNYIIKNCFKKVPINPHAVNPFYVKKIEVLK